MLPRFSWLANRLGPRGDAGARRRRARDEAAANAGPLRALPVAPSRFRSIAWPLIGVLVLVAGWTVGISYYFHQRGAEQLFLNEQRE